MSLNRYNPKRDSNERGLIRLLESAGCYVDQLSGRDIPDLLVTHPNGKIFTVEVKTEAGVLSDGQKAYMKRQVDRNALSFVCTTSGDVRLALEIVSND